MKIEFDQFLITIKPKEKGESVLSQLTRLTEIPAVTDLIRPFVDRYAPNAPCGCHGTAQQLPELSEIDIQFINELGTTILDPDVIIPDKTISDDSAFEPFYTAPQWQTVKLVASKFGIIEISEWIRQQKDVAEFEPVYAAYIANEIGAQARIADFCSFVRTLP